MHKRRVPSDAGGGDDDGISEVPPTVGPGSADWREASYYGRHTWSWGFRTLDFAVPVRKGSLVCVTGAAETGRCRFAFEIFRRHVQRGGFGLFVAGSTMVEADGAAPRALEYFSHTPLDWERFFWDQAQACANRVPEQQALIVVDEPENLHGDEFSLARIVSMLGFIAEGAEAVVVVSTPLEVLRDEASASVHLAAPRASRPTSGASPNGVDVTTYVEGLEVGTIPVKFERPDGRFREVGPRGRRA